MSEDLFELEDKRRLELGLVTRENIVKELTKNNQLPTDTSSREFLLRAIEGMDETIMKKVKIKSEDKLQESQNQIANNIADLLKRVNISKQSGKVVDSPFLDNSIVVSDPVPGETTIGVDSALVKQELSK